MRLATALSGLALLLVLSGAFSTPAAAEDRTLTFKQMHTGETLTVTYKRNGRYDQAALKKINYILRDWRRNEATNMDPALMDLIWDVRRKLGTNAPVHVLSGYRSPVTNAALRSRSSGVAQQSQHMRGRALDFFLPGVNLTQLRAAGLREQVGGVGFYPTSGSPFIHLDTGSVRHWPRMSRQQLAKVFPDGKTLHIPSDGRPMDGYQVALAEAERRKSGGGTSSGQTQSRGLFAALGGGRRSSDDPAAPVRASGGRNFFASLFGNAGEEDDEEQATGRAPAARPAPQRTQVAAAPAAPAAAPRQEPAAMQVAAANAPLPPARPERPAPAAAAAEPAEAASAPVVLAANVPMPVARPAMEPALEAAEQPEPAAVAAKLDVPMPPEPPKVDSVLVAAIMPPERPLITSAATPRQPARIEPNIVTALAPAGADARRDLPFDRTFTNGTLTTSVKLVPMDLSVKAIDAVATSATVWRTGNGLGLRHPDQRDLEPLFERASHFVDNRFVPRGPLDYANGFKGAPINHLAVKTIALAGRR
ncbi:DUF882 domain-containing protein [Lutibaculum baratangense]|nr:DUF882 domain-containing protein [Lutibaculum baratangense]